MAEQPKGLTKLACFDLDGTIVNAKSRNTFHRTADGWTFFNDAIVKKLRILFSYQYRPPGNLNQSRSI